MVGGVTPGKGGQTHLDLPVFDTVHEAVARTGANASVIYVPPPFAADSIPERVDPGLPLVFCITGGIPGSAFLRAKPPVCGPGPGLLGPTCPGVFPPAGGPEDTRVELPQLIPTSNAV